MHKLDSTVARRALVSGILIVLAGMTIQQALGPDVLLRDALRGDPDRHLNAVMEQLAPIDVWAREISQGNSIAMCFRAVTPPTDNHRMAAAKFYQRGTYALYPLRIYVMPADDQILVNAEELVESRFNPNRQWCAQHGVQRVVTFYLSGADDVMIQTTELPPSRPGGIAP